MIYIKAELLRALAEAIVTVSERFVDEDVLPTNHMANFTGMEIFVRSNIAALEALEFVAKEKVNVIPTPEWEPA